MPCDERYRAWAMRRAPVPAPPELCRARLTRVTPCPARPGFRELHFDAEGVPWSWCFPAPARRRRLRAGAYVGSLVLRPGPQGLIAEAVTGPEAAPPEERTVDLARAADLAVASVPVFVHRDLLGHANARRPAGPQVTAPDVLLARNDW